LWLDLITYVYVFIILTYESVIKFSTTYIMKKDTKTNLSDRAEL